jgi:protein SCO1/2
MKLRRIVTATLWIWLLFPVNAWPHGAESHVAARAPSKPVARRVASPARKYFTDVLLVNQNGKSMRFYSDLLQGKVVVINSFYTKCTDACPVLTQQIAKIQDTLGDHVGKDVHLISISLDPITDTPPRLKTYAERFRAKPGWYFLTGKKANVDLALNKIGHYVDAKETHLNVLIMGNERTGLWKKAFGMAKTDQLVKLVIGLLNDQ